MYVYIYMYIYIHICIYIYIYTHTHTIYVRAWGGEASCARPRTGPAAAAAGGPSRV